MRMSWGLGALTSVVILVALVGCSGSPESLSSQSRQGRQTRAQESSVSAQPVSSTGLTEADVQALPARLDQVTEALYSAPGGTSYSGLLDAYTETLTTPEYRENNLAHMSGLDQYTEEMRNQMVVMDMQILATHIKMYDWELQGDNTILFEPMESGSRKRVAFRQFDGVWLVDDIWLDGQ